MFLFLMGVIIGACLTFAFLCAMASFFSAGITYATLWPSHTPGRWRGSTTKFQVQAKPPPE